MSEKKARQIIFPPWPFCVLIGKQGGVLNTIAFSPLQVLFNQRSSVARLN
jgi:hypothetical protein